MRLCRRVTYSINKVFQSTHPRGVRLYLRNKRVISRMFQSTHPRGVRQITFVSYGTDKVVSIHAPTRGATIDSSNFRVQFEVSIHAPTRGATWPIACSRYNLRFQSTHPRGVRHDVESLNYNQQCFNPRTHEGCDLTCSNSRGIDLSFNPRTHEGCD